MTNVLPEQNMQKLQKIAHCHTYVMVFKPDRNEKDYWQKIWLINRYAVELGFKRSYLK